MTNKTLHALDPIHLPLNQVNLIEASAGTGKTHTIASLYLRLLLQVGENPFPMPLRVDQILVVTFTNMATEELKGRIRERIHEAKQAFEQVEATGDVDLFVADPFLHTLIHEVLHTSSLTIAITQLTLAEQDFDLAAIFTIHGFCQRMLKRYAFNSGVPFEIELLEPSAELALKKRFACELWRTYFYPLSLEMVQFVRSVAKNPEELLRDIQPLINKNLATNLSENEGSLADFLANQADSQRQFIVHQQAFKQHWLASVADLQVTVAAREADISRIKNKQNGLAKVTEWAQTETFSKAPEQLAKYFTLQSASQVVKKGKAPFEHSILAPAEAYVAAEQAFFSHHTHQQQLLRYHFLQALTARLHEYKVNHREKSFDDLLWLMENALAGEQGEALAQAIRHQYPFAMIDEFQDTDAQQYFIFKQIYLQAATQETGFLMIGDPKQSIYKFRGADIFAYLNAAQSAESQFTLDQNWRSNAGLIQAVNSLFDFSASCSAGKSPFLHQQIQFQPVTPAKSENFFVFRGVNEPAVRIYLQSGENKKINERDLAETCALSIRQWLEKAQQEQANIDNEPLQPKHIAVLLRNKQQAQLIKTALAKQGINSVYVSDKSNVFASDLAKDLLFILQACLHPLNEKNILNALSCELFGLSLGEIDEIKQQESCWEATVQRFLDYQRVWQRQGVLPMLHQLMQQEELIHRKFLRAEGERNLTNFLHLAELLQQASVLNESEAALVRWYEKNLSEKGDKVTSAEIRLESDRALVKLVTIHKSKGLAYDLVWLPFIGLSCKNPTARVQTYYDAEQNQVQLDISQTHTDDFLHESLAEEMRLLYVALTRAKYQVAMTLPTTFGKNKGKDLMWNALWFALTGGNLAFDNAEQAATMPLLANWQTRAGQKNIVIEDASTLPRATKPLASQASHADLALQVAHFTQKIEYDWQVTSFTQIKSQHLFHTMQTPMSVSHYTIAARDDDIENLSIDETGWVEKVKKEASEPTSVALITPPYPEKFSPFDFPAGQRVGIALHRFLSKFNFQIHLDLAQAEHRQRLFSLAEQIGLLTNDDPQTELALQSLALWLNRIMQTPFTPAGNLCLRDIAPSQRLNELEFFFRVKTKCDFHQFNQLLAQYHHLNSESVVAEDFLGLMHGFIDLVFEHDGQYYLVDYKSTLLGKNQEAYQFAHLEQAILHEHYDWQYLIYSVALHRYLRQRLPTYDYDRDFGGVIYLFLRGMTGQARDGVFFDKPSKMLIEGLENLFIC